eukprot:scaffold6198_cov408-Prasinococcus_capsulatus_cf.AAC.12
MGRYSSSLSAVIGLCLSLASTISEAKSDTSAATEAYIVPEVEITLNTNKSRAEEEDPPVAWDLWVCRQILHRQRVLSVAKCRTRLLLRSLFVVDPQLRGNDTAGPAPIKDVEMSKGLKDYSFSMQIDKDEGTITTFSVGPAQPTTSSKMGAGTMSFSKQLFTIIFEEEFRGFRPCLKNAFFGLGITPEGKHFQKLVPGDGKWENLDKESRELNTYIPRCNDDPFQGIVNEMERKLNEFVSQGTFTLEKASELWDKERAKDEFYDKFLDYEEKGLIKMNPFKEKLGLPHVKEIKREKKDKPKKERKEEAKVNTIESSNEDEQPPQREGCVDSKTWNEGFTCEQVESIWKKNERAGEAMCKQDGAMENCPKACRACDEDADEGGKAAHDEL